ncbi:MAG: hypothetical protein M3092_04435 [Actinomycetia bacterium]|nr:hypothetical protein [Actinomycetes bacterium]
MTSPSVGSDGLKGKIAALSQRFLAWALAALLMLLGAEGVLWAFGEDSYVLSEIAWLTFFAVAGWAIQRYRQPFDDAVSSLVDLTPIKVRAKAAKEASDLDRQLFTPRSGWLIATIFAMTAVWFVTMYLLKPPFTHGLINGLSYIFFIPMAIVGAWGSFIVIAAVVAVRRIANRGLVAPFSVSRHPTLLAIERDWVGAGFLIVMIYVLFLTAFWFSPYGLAIELTVWLAVIALVPSFWFIVGTYQLNRMLSRLKQQHLKHAAETVQRLSSALDGDTSSSELVELGVAMDIEAKVQAMPEWPSAFMGISGVALALTPIAIQVALISLGFGVAL